MKEPWVAVHFVSLLYAECELFAVTLRCCRGKIRRLIEEAIGS